jgi:hypothetical protein
MQTHIEYGSTAQQVEVFDIEGRRVVNAEVLINELSALHGQRDAARQYPLKQWNRVTALLVRSCLDCGLFVEESDSGFSFEEILLVSFLSFSLTRY